MIEGGNIVEIGNLPEGIEVVERLAANAGMRLERMISQGKATPSGEWYDQEWPEWVLLLRGEASLLFGDGSIQNLVAGDFLSIPAGVRHRVEAASGDAVWLALHYRDDDGEN